MVFDNTIYGIPCQNSLFLLAHWVRQDLLDAEGLSQPRSADEYKLLAMHFTRPDPGLYVLGGENNVGMGMTNGWMTGIFGTPNTWALDKNSGKLTGYVETDQFRQAVSYARDLWAAGAFDPDSLQYNLVSARNQFAARRFMFRMDAWMVASDLFWANAARRDPPGNPRVMGAFPASAGGQPTYWSTNALLGYSVIKQAPPDRIKEILRVMNWLAAPLGSQEYLLKAYGIKDQHWTPDANGNPILNDLGKPKARSRSITSRAGRPPFIGRRHPRTHRSCMTPRLRSTPTFRSIRPLAITRRRTRPNCRLSRATSARR